MKKLVSIDCVKLMAFGVALAAMSCFAVDLLLGQQARPPQKGAVA